jgi:cell division protein ZapD
MNQASIIYEQPLNELIRLCLRLEHLFQLIDYHHNQPFVENSRSAMTALLEVLNVIERPDLKTKLVKTLTHHADNLAQLEKIGHVDQHKLANCLAELDNLIDILHSLPGRIGQALKENDFLSTVRARLSIPAGDSNFNLLGYQRWLAHPAERRIQDLKHWMQSYDQLKAATDFLLKLTRQNANPIQITIEDGFLQHNLDANISWQLVRIAMPLHPEIYPEISVGRHRLSIRTHTLNANGRPVQNKTPTTCLLTLCAG